ncbi:regulatory protein RecX [Agreia sp.]|uniref:regulatory protein RecX n=1 Tax=Agreia sp. TaxID=1872416 RepID=UPI0035BC5E35
MVRFTESPDDTDNNSAAGALDESVAPVTFLFGEPDAQPQVARYYAGPIAVPTLDTSGLTPQQVEDQELQLADLESLVVRALARKDLSEWQVTEILAANGVNSSAFEGFLTIYRSKGYVDDYAFAEREIERLHRRKGFGRSQIQRELGAKRVSQEIVSDLLTALDDDDELARALELAEKKAPSLLRLDRATAERRLSSFLQRKGYPSQVVRDAVSKTLATAPSSVRFR